MKTNSPSVSAAPLPPRQRSARLVAFVSLLPLSAAIAQTVGLPERTATEADTILLDRYVVTDPKSTETTLPVRPVTAVYGFDTPIQDVPRSITQINPQQFSEDVIGSTSDFTRYSPAVNQATGNLGNFGSPTLRGALGEAFQNDIRLLNRQSNNRPFTLNAYEAADIVAGPAPSIFGPSARTAGYANYLTKKPYFDRDRTTVTFHLGKWYGDDVGYNRNLNYQLDTGAPLIPGKLAYRLSYQGENVDSYYKNSGDKWNDLYGTLAWLPNKNLTVDWNFEYGRFDYQLPGGFNRITSDFIANGTYLAGPATPILKGSFSSTGYYSPVYLPGAGFNGTQFIARTKVGNSYVAGNALTGAPTQAQAATIQGYVFDPALVHPQKLADNDGFNNPLADSWTRAFNTQLRVKRTVSDGFTLVNNTAYQYYQTNNYNGGQSENYIEAIVFENRTEFRLRKFFSFLGQNIEHDSNSGLSLRYDYVLNYKDTDATNTSSAGDYYDITNPATYGRNAFFGAQVEPLLTNTVLTRFGWVKGFNLALPVPQLPAYYSTPGGSGTTGTGTTATGLSAATNQTSVDGLGLFSQHSFKIGDRWIWDAGVRATGVWAKLNNPLAANDSNALIQDHTADLLPSVSTSLSYKPTPRVTTYLTYSYVQAQNGMTTGSPTWSPGNTLSAKNFHSVSDLEEAGAKFTLVPDQLFGGVAIYRQTRDLTYQAVVGGDPILARGLYRGLEANLRWQPTRYFDLGLNYTYLAANYINNAVTAPAPLTADNATLISQSTSLGLGNWRITNLPRNNVTFYSAVQLGYGLGLKTDLWLRDNYIVTGDGSVKVPGEYNLNVGAFYRGRRWFVAVDVQNLTSQRNFAGSTTILEPRTVQATFRRSF